MNKITFKTVLTVLFAFAMHMSSAQTTLSPGDIAFTGFNLDGDDSYSFILLKDIDAATTINFTDCGWNDGSGFNCPTGDSPEWVWSAIASRNCGTVITIITNPALTADVGSVAGSVPDMNELGDQIFAFQGTTSTPSLISGIHSNISAIGSNANWDHSSTDNQTSALPDVLTNGVNAIRVYLGGFGDIERDNWQYNCAIESGDIATIRAAINDFNNWIFDDGQAYNPVAPNCNWAVTCPAQNTEFITTWKTDNPGTTDDFTVTIPTGAGTFNYNVDWGDGTTSNGLTSSATHTYAAIGTYTVTITGDFPHLNGNNYFDDGEKLLSVEQWGSQTWGSMRSSFHSCSNLVINAIDTPDLSLVTDMHEMFINASSMNHALISTWDVSNVTNMSNSFNGTTNFNIDISGWSVDNVTDMTAMFNVSAFNQDIGNWNVSNVTNMYAMFSNSAFNQDISSWNVSNVTNMSGMFSNSTFNHDIGSWIVNNVTNMGSMFYYNNVFNQNISNWDVSSVTNMSWMFGGTSLFNQDISNWNVSNVNNFKSMFYNSGAFNQDVSSWDVSNAFNISWMFRNASQFNQNLGAWDISSVTDISDMFNGTTLSLANYDNTLMGWNTLDVGETQIPTGLNFHGGNSVYCNGLAARTNLMNTYGWTITDGGIDCSTLSIASFDTTNLVLYPNPVSTSFKIAGLSDSVQLQIINIHGQLVKTIANYSSQMVNIEALTPGVYFAKLNTGTATKTFKIIKTD